MIYSYILRVIANEFKVNKINFIYKTQYDSNIES